MRRFITLRQLITGEVAFLEFHVACDGRLLMMSADKIEIWSRQRARSLTAAGLELRAHRPRRSQWDIPRLPVPTRQAHPRLDMLGERPLAGGAEVSYSENIRAVRGKR